MHPSCFTGQFSAWQQGLDFTLRHSQANWVPSISWQVRVRLRETWRFAGWACMSLCSAMSNADLFSGRCSIAPMWLWRKALWLLVGTSRVCYGGNLASDLVLEPTSLCTPWWHAWRRLAFDYSLRRTGFFAHALWGIEFAVYASNSSIPFVRRPQGVINGNNHFSGLWGNASSQSKLHKQEQ